MFASRSEAVARANASIATGLNILFAGASQLPSTQARLAALAIREHWSGSIPLVQQKTGVRERASKGLERRDGARRGQSELKIAQPWGKPPA
jgi:hypothetical protein